MENTALQNVGVVLLLLGVLAAAIRLVVVVIRLLRGQPTRGPLLWLVAAIGVSGAGVALILVDADRVRPFDPARATALAHAALIEPAALGSGWSVVAVDPVDGGPAPHPGEACTRMRAMERDIDANYDPRVAGRASLHLWRAAAAGSPIPTTVDIEVMIFPAVEDATGAVAAWQEIAWAETTSQCLSDDIGAEVTTRDPLMAARSGGFAASYQIRPPTPQLPDLRHERHQWPYRNAMVTVSLTGTSAGIDAALARAAIEGTDGAVRRTAEDQDAALREPRRYIPNLARVIAQLEEETAALDVARQLGDEVAGTRAGDLAEVVRRSEAATARLQQIERIPETAAIHDAAAAWSVALTQAARGGPGAWAARPATPAPASLSVSVPQRQALLEAALPRLAAVGAAAPTAASRDRESARWVRARLAVQLLSLDRLAVGTDDLCVRSGCVRAALPAVRALQAATDQLAAGTANAPGTEWSQAWTAFDLAVRPGGQPVFEVGLTQGAPNAVPLSAPVRLFADTCREGGGLVDDTGGVRALPTTEGGWTCWSADRACWHFLTHSGALHTFGGTGVGCPAVAAIAVRLGAVGLAAPGVAEVGAARVAEPAPGAPAAPVAPPQDPPTAGPPAQPPAAPPLLPTVPTTPAFNGLDGIYRLRIGDAACSDGRVVDRRQTLGFLGIPDTDSPTLTVRDRRVLGMVPSTAIDASGLVVASGGIGTNISTSDRLQFSSRGDSAVFTAEHTRRYAADQVSCRVLYEGERIAP